jgi:hypothetical protein
LDCAQPAAAFGSGSLLPGADTASSRTTSHLAKIIGTTFVFGVVEDIQGLVASK